MKSEACKYFLFENNTMSCIRGENPCPRTKRKNILGIGCKYRPLTKQVESPAFRTLCPHCGKILVLTGVEK
jgi:hypothetical protein